MYVYVYTVEYMWYVGFPGDAVVKNLPADPGNVRDAGSYDQPRNQCMISHVISE